MLRPLASRFLLPLVKGGSLHVGRPMGPEAVAALVEAWAAFDSRRLAVLGPAEVSAANELGRLRGKRARTLLLDLPTPPLDEASLRLGAALHDLLLLSHPGLGDEVGIRRRAVIAEAAHVLADLGPPGSAAEAVRRHTLLYRVPEIVQPERLVSYWLGRQRFVGQTPPARLLAFPRMRRVQLEETRRLWLTEVGVAVPARPAWLALARANPLGEALDPLRLDPPLAWARILPALRFPSIARLVAGRVLELGLVAAGSALAGALFQHAALRDPGPTSSASVPGALSFGIRFLSHALWLSLLFSREEPPAAGGDLGALLAAAAEVDPRLVFPPDVAGESEVGRRFAAVIRRWRAAADALEGGQRYGLALGVSRQAARESAAAAAGAQALATTVPH